LDPSPIKNLILTKDRERIFNTGGQTSQLFLTNTSNHIETNQQIGQQDARDFLISLKEYKEHWMDFFNLFSNKVDTYTVCQMCKNKSAQSISNEHIFLEFECPEDGTNMSQFIESKLNQPEHVTDWRDEDGCHQKGSGLLFNKVKTIEESELIIIVIKRLVNVGRGPEILRSKLPLGGDATITDSNNQTGIYRPLAVLFHIGDVEGHDTYGHYKADVLTPEGNWFRTSDEDVPRKISERSVSNQGYIFLYKRMTP
jgi:ubiquitin C-terminal hydrolase